MNAKKIIIASAAATLISGGVVAGLVASNLIGGSLINAAENVYTLKLDASTGSLVDNSGSLALTTEDGNTINFAYTGLSYSDGAYTLAAGGVFS